jgi:membrane-associated HD superfamily phosphohydrolase
MMIALNEWQYSLLTRIEKENCTDYGIKEIGGDYYISLDTILEALDETQNYREYAEEQLIQLNDKLNDMPDVEVNSLQLSTVKALNELRIENDNLKQENETLRREVENICNEDMLDRLNMEGVEL